MLELGLIIGFFPAVGWVSSFLLPGPVQGPKKTPVIRPSTMCHFPTNQSELTVHVERPRLVVELRPPRGVPGRTSTSRG